jgi:chromosome segregation ATPase
LFSLTKKKAVTQPTAVMSVPDTVTVQRLDNLEKQLRALEDHYTELEHSIAEKEQRFKESLEAYKTEVSSVLKTFTERVMHIDKEIVHASHYAVKRDELFKLISKLSETLNGIKTDMELPF